MNIAYNILIDIFKKILLPIASIVSDRIKSFIKVRINLLEKISSDVDKNKEYIWIHAASLGEYELAIPLIKEIKKKFKEEIILTFFSESGFKLDKRINEISHTYYLPIDTKNNARKFIKIINPKIAIFIKSEIWPNYVKELSKKNINTYIVNYSYNKFVSKILNNTIRKFNKIYVQDKISMKKLESLGLNNIEYSGNLKFNRALLQKKEIYKNDRLHKYLKGHKCLVCGSTWIEDEEIIIKYIKSNEIKDFKYIIAPHIVSKENIERIKNKFEKKVNLLSDNKYNIHYNVLIVDSIGVLKYIYKFAYVSYVGGGFKIKGLHNILESCIYGNPIIIGKNYKFFNEAEDLIGLKGGFSIKNSTEFKEILNELLSNEKKRKEIKTINSKFINDNLVSINQIINSIKNE
ncbi:MAG: hypothetical protein DBW74_02320 [Cryomorphaceae bacterium]|nr:MAG: hypothetical protein DBW74_02320 [Cryomorphaceae bacterium]